MKYSAETISAEFNGIPFNMESTVFIEATGKTRIDKRLDQTVYPWCFLYQVCTRYNLDETTYWEYFFNIYVDNANRIAKVSDMTVYMNSMTGFTCHCQKQRPTQLDYKLFCERIVKSLLEHQDMLSDSADNS